MTDTNETSTAAAPSLTLEPKDLPGALKVSEYLLRTYNSTRQDATAPSQFEETLLVIVEDILESVNKGIRAPYDPSTESTYR